MACAFRVIVTKTTFVGLFSFKESSNLLHKKQKDISEVSLRNIIENSL